MKNVLHFAKCQPLTSIEATALNLPLDSGNGYYSYNYYSLPFSGTIDDAGRRSISHILHKRHYRAPFTSFGSIEHVAVKDGGGTIIYGVTYHHGD